MKITDTSEDENDDSAVVSETEVTSPVPEQTEHRRKKKRLLYWSHIQNRNYSANREELLLLSPIDYFRKIFHFRLYRLTCRTV